MFFPILVLLSETLLHLNPPTQSSIQTFSPADSKAIVDGNLKLILGLIWTLILHYSISMPVWEGEDEEVDVQPPPTFSSCLKVFDP